MLKWFGFFLAKYWGKLGNFLFYHLVTLQFRRRRLSSSKMTSPSWSEKISSHKNYDPILKLNNFFLLTGRRRRDKSASQEIKKKGFYYWRGRLSCFCRNWLKKTSRSFSSFLILFLSSKSSIWKSLKLLQPSIGWWLKSMINYYLIQLTGIILSVGHLHRY